MHFQSFPIIIGRGLKGGFGNSYFFLYVHTSIFGRCLTCVRHCNLCAISFLLQAIVIHCATNARIEGFRLCFFRFCHDFCFWAKIPPKHILILFVSVPKVFGMLPVLFTFNPYRGYADSQNFEVSGILHHSRQRRTGVDRRSILIPLLRSCFSHF